MVPKFADSCLEDALDRSLKNSKHLRARDAAAVKAARLLARKIDAWDQIVDWAIEDSADSGGRPAVPANDNVSIATFLKFMDALGLLPESDGQVSGGKQKSPQLSQLDAWRAKKSKSA